MQTEYSTKQSFDAARYIPKSDKEETEIKIYSYTLEISFITPHSNTDPFTTLTELIQKKIIKQLDHSLLNDHISHPSLNEIAAWITNQLQSTEIVEGPFELTKVQLWEGDKISATLHVRQTSTQTRLELPSERH